MPSGSSKSPPLTGGLLTAAEIIEILHQVKDPEVPVVDIVELGIVRDVEIDGATVTVLITPTYSGCPALKTIEEDILATLKQHGIAEAKLEIVLSPPWTTDWIAESAKEKLKAFGISPPHSQRAAADNIVPFSTLTKRVPCPRCDSFDTTCTSQFGATACKAMYVCNACLEPFEFFKEI